MSNIDKTPRSQDKTMKKTSKAKPSADSSKVQTSMQVVTSTNEPFGVVDHMDGPSAIKLNRDDAGVHHWIPLSWVSRIDDKLHLDRTREQATRDWTITGPRA